MVTIMLMTAVQITACRWNNSQQCTMSCLQKDPQAYVHRLCNLAAFHSGSGRLTFHMRTEFCFCAAEDTICNSIPCPHPSATNLFVSYHLLSMLDSLGVLWQVRVTVGFFGVSLRLFHQCCLQLSVVSPRILQLSETSTACTGSQIHMLVRHSRQSTQQITTEFILSAVAVQLVVRPHHAVNKHHSSAAEEQPLILSAVASEQSLQAADMAHVQMPDSRPTSVRT